MTTIPNWQYDDLKETLKKLVEGDNVQNRDVLHHCLLHFERLDLWLKRIQEAYHYEEHERKHVERKLYRIAEIIEMDISND